jgi:excisionase family DNA binding protein
MAKILTVRQAAELLQASEETVRDWLRRGRIPGRRVGRSWRISEEALLDWLRVNGEEGGNQ